VERWTNDFRTEEFLKIENTKICKFERLKIKQLLTANHGPQPVSGLLEK